MAIVQISRITNRKGLQENLPQLAGAELGWSIDTRQLYIGNGTLEEGAPIIGNTEILTEFSDILEFQTTYTYKGQAAGYIVQTGPTVDSPVTQSLQSWLDQFATVKDFGAVGDGVTDDTEAINRALYQIFCRESNPQIRRSLFFPAGVYRVTQTILVPAYATLYGEGTNNSIIQLDNSTDDSTLNAFVVRTTDSLQQYGANIGTNGAVSPRYITIRDMGFKNLDPTTNVCLVEDANNCTFQRVGFYGPLTISDLDSDFNDSAGVRFASTASLTTNQIVIDDCEFSGTVYGINSASAQGGYDQEVTGVIVRDSKFAILYQGVVLGVETIVGNGATGIRILGNRFDNIYAEGVLFGAVNLNATGHNMFYGVGNHFGPITTPYTAIINIQSSNNVSVSDLFARPNGLSGPVQNPGSSFPRVTLNNSVSIAMVNGSELQAGTYTRNSGVLFTLNNNVSNATIFTVNTTYVPIFSVQYSITRDTALRTGIFTVVQGAGGSIITTDDYTENSSTGITLSATQSTNIITFKYSSTNTSITGYLSYSVVTI